MSRVALIHDALGQSCYGSIRYEPAAVHLTAQVFNDPDWLYAYACCLLAAADRLRKEQSK